MAAIIKEVLLTLVGIGAAGGLVFLLAMVIMFDRDRNRLEQRIRHLADANYRKHLIDTGGGTAEFVNSIKSFNIPQKYFDDARKVIRP